MICEKFNCCGTLKEVILTKIKQELALILRTQGFSDNDLILTLLSQNSGKISAIIKKVRGKAAYSPEMLDLANFDLKDPGPSGSLYGVRSVKAEKSFAGLRSKLPSFLCACAWSEAIDCMTLEQHHEASELFDHARNVLAALDSENDARGALKILYHGLKDAIRISGFGDYSNDQPSLNNLKTLAHQIESLSHRKLKSFSDLYSLAAKLGKAAD